jgi:hypothetical protein
MANKMKKLQSTALLSTKVSGKTTINKAKNKIVYELRPVSLFLFTIKSTTKKLNNRSPKTPVCMTNSSGI